MKNKADFLLLKPKINLTERLRSTILSILFSLGICTSLLIFSTDQNGGVQISTENISTQTGTTNNIPNNQVLDKLINTNGYPEAKYAEVQNGELILSDQPLRKEAPTVKSALPITKPIVLINNASKKIYQPNSIESLGFQISLKGDVERIMALNLANKELYSLSDIPPFTVTNVTVTNAPPSSTSELVYFKVPHPSSLTLMAKVSQPSSLTLMGLMYAILAFSILIFLFVTEERPHFRKIKYSHHHTM